MNTSELLAERNETHGSFKDNSEVSQHIKDIIRNSPNWSKFHPIHKESLDYIAGKIGRLCAGDFEFEDTWLDIAGYAKLPEKFNHGRNEQSRLASDSSSVNSNSGSSIATYIPDDLNESDGFYTGFPVTNANFSERDD